MWQIRVCEIHRPAFNLTHFCHIWVMACHPAGIVGPDTKRAENHCIIESPNHLTQLLNHVLGMTLLKLY